MRDRIESYVDWANTLDSTGTDSTEARERLKDLTTLSHIFGNMRNIIKAGSQADELKKWVFYGKNFEPSNLVPLPSGTIDTMRGGFDSHETVRIYHAILGLVTEAAELMEMFQAHITEGVEINWRNFTEEVGDLFWYLALCAKAQGYGTFAPYMISNKAKLVARYGETWTQDAALNRDTVNEMKELGISLEQYPSIAAVVAQLEFCQFTDAHGHALENSQAFIALKALTGDTPITEGDIDDTQSRLG